MTDLSTCINKKHVISLNNTDDLRSHGLKKTQYLTCVRVCVCFYGEKTQPEEQEQTGSCLAVDVDDTPCSRAFNKQSTIFSFGVCEKPLVGYIFD